MLLMLFISSICELVKFDRAQTRSFNEVCANDKYYENSIFENEDSFRAPDDSDDGINNTGIISSHMDRAKCNYNIHMSQQLKDRTLAFFNRIRWLTGYQNNITWDDTKEEETCQCSFVRWATGRPLDSNNSNALCTQQAPKWEKGCMNSSHTTFYHRKITNGVYILYGQIAHDIPDRNNMLSPHLTKTSMCSVSQGKRTKIFGFESVPVEYFTMNFHFNERSNEELPFIASPPPGFIPFYMMPTSASLLAKDIKNPKLSEFKVYYNGSLISGYNETQTSFRENYHGYIFNLNYVNRNYSHLINKTVPHANNLFFPPGSVFGFEATNNGKTYAWNTTLVDCTRDAGKYPDPTPAPTKSIPKSKPTFNAGTTTTTKTTNNGDGTSNQKLRLSSKQKVGIGIGVTVGVAAVAVAVVGGLFLAGVIGSGSASAGSAAGDSAITAAGTSALAA